MIPKQFKMDRCACCLKSSALRKGRRRKKIVTTEEAKQYSFFTEKNIEIGDILCYKCRLIRRVPEKNEGEADASDTECIIIDDDSDTESVTEPTTSAVVVAEHSVENPNYTPTFDYQPSHESEDISLSTQNQFCAACKRYFLKDSRTKIINSDDEAIKFSAHLGKNLKIGDTLCQKCRLQKVTSTSSNLGHSQLLQPAEMSERRGQKRSLPFVPAMNMIDSASETSGGSQPQSQSSSDYEPPAIRPAVEEEYVLMPKARVLITHRYCFICSSETDLKVVPFAARLQAFVHKGLYIHPQNRCCVKHLTKDRFYQDELNLLCPTVNFSHIPVSDLTKLMDAMSIRSNSSLLDEIGDFSYPESKLKSLIGFNYKDLDDLHSLLTSMRDSSKRDVVSALAVFLFKMRNGLSDEKIAAIFKLDRPQSISRYCEDVMRSFEKDVLPTNFGVDSISREELIENHTAPAVKRLFNIENKLVIICDGTYIRHQKSANNSYQRRSFSGQKKVPLCKPFTICATDGYIIDIPGPYYATENDATILKKVLADPYGIRKLLREGDVFILDRGFRDVVKWLEEQKFQVFMPALKGTRSQLPTSEANFLRFVTKLRWVIEAAHGIIGQKFGLLHQQLDNKLLPKIRMYCRIACFLYNRFVKRLFSDQQLFDPIMNRMKARLETENELTSEVEEKKWLRRKSLFTFLSSEDLTDFPELSKEELTIFFTGSYQLKQAVSYLAELMEKISNFDQLQVGLLKNENGDQKTIRLHIQSRHINRKQYRVFIRYKPGCNSVEGIIGHSCECANGNRTIGSCSHVAAIVFYLAFARYQSKIVQPNAILSHLFDTEQFTEEVTIDDDSDND